MSGKPFEGLGDHALARGLSWAYELGRRAHAQYRLRHQEQIDIPVVSVGNLVVGGTGKTPLTASIARRLAEKHRTAILSRGYGGKERGPLRVLDDSDPRMVGDEPVELAYAVPAAEVWIARNRVLGAREIESEGAEVIILDDGFAYRTLHRDVDLLLFDERGLGNGLLLPAGPLREEPAAMERADGVLLRGNAKPPPQWTGAVFRFDVKPSKFTTLWGETAERPTASIAAAGIAWPQRFFDSLRSQKIDILKSYALPDHASWKAGLIAELEQAAGNKPILITAKDAVKLRPHRPAGNWIVAHVVAEIERGFWPWLDKRLW